MESRKRSRVLTRRILSHIHNQIDSLRTTAIIFTREREARKRWSTRCISIADGAGRYAKEETGEEIADKAFTF